jgi:predicted dehydrogenase
MAIRLADCEAMIQTAAAEHVKLRVVCQRCFYEPVLRVRQASSKAVSTSLRLGRSWCWADGTRIAIGSTRGGEPGREKRAGPSCRT